MSDLKPASDEPTHGAIRFSATSDRLLATLIADMASAAAIDDPEMRRDALGHLQQSCRALADAYGVINGISRPEPPSAA